MPVEDSPEVVREAVEATSAEGVLVKANVPVFQHNRMMGNNNSFDAMLDRSSIAIFQTLFPAVLARASESILSDKPSELMGEMGMSAVGTKYAYGAVPAGFTGVGIPPATT